MCNGPLKKDVKSLTYELFLRKMEGMGAANNTQSPWC